MLKLSPWSPAKNTSPRRSLTLTLSFIGAAEVFSRDGRDATKFKKKFDRLDPSRTRDEYNLVEGGLAQVREFRKEHRRRRR